MNRHCQFPGIKIKVSPTKLRQGGDGIGVVNKIKRIFSRQDSVIKPDLDKKETSAVETGIPDAEVSCGKKPGINGEDKARFMKTLTPRERDAFVLLMEGYTLKETAIQLKIGYSTANTYQTSIYKKLHVNSRAGLIINYRNFNWTTDTG
jgi:DNA-binding CsgD family transcriptional regulator